MLDDDGKEVPGTKGYKYVVRNLSIDYLSISHFVRYFGRAKELPGVKELFQGRQKEQDEENQAQAFYKKFTEQGPAYFGDLDEKDEKLLAYEREVEQKGMRVPSYPSLFNGLTSSPEWEEASSNVKDSLGLSSLPPMPQPKNATNGDVEMEDGTKTNGADDAHADPDALKRARAGAAFIPLLSTEDLLPPNLPTKAEIEGVLLDLRKKALVTEYFGDQ